MIFFMKIHLSQKIKRYILIIIFVLIIGRLVYSVRSSLTPFIIGAVVAYLVAPLANFIDRFVLKIIKNKNLAKLISVFIALLVLTLILALLISVYINVIVKQIREFIEGFSGMGPKLDIIYERLKETLPEDVFNKIREVVISNFDKIKETINESAAVTAGKAFELVMKSVGFVFSLIIVPIWVFSVLVDRERLSISAKNAIPQSIRKDIVNLVRVVDKVLKKYLKGQLILSTVVGGLATIGLYLLGVDYALPLGIIAAFTENIPTVGPYVGMVPALIVAYPQGLGVFIPVLILYLGIQLLENLFLVPRIAGKSTNIDPAIIMIVLIIGGAYAGVWGMILAAPVTAIIRDVFHYIYLRFSDREVKPEEAIQRVGKERIIIDGV